MRGFIYNRLGWPNFTWDNDALIKALSMVSHRQGRLIGRMEGLGFALQSEAILQSITIEILKSNEIEGEFLDRDQVRSSIAKKLGMDIAGLVPADRKVDGIVEVMLNATQHFREPLSEERLCNWHSSLFPTVKGGNEKMLIGKWRDNSTDDPMQVVSGPLGKERVHYQAPDSNVLAVEMSKFLNWFNKSDEVNPILKAAVAHLWFVTIHPFDDGNGRIARTLAEMQLARADGLSKRFYSMSSQIRTERKKYYDILEKTQRGSTDITEWLIWFLNCLDRALIASEEELSNVISKAKFWDRIKQTELNDRQRKMINKLLDGFEGKLTSSKWAKINKCSQDTSLRDLQDLIAKDILKKEADGGRSTHYTIQLIQ